MLYYLVESNGELELVLEATREIVGKPVMLQMLSVCSRGLDEECSPISSLLILVGAVYMVRARYSNCVIYLMPYGRHQKK